MHPHFQVRQHRGFVCRFLQKILVYDEALIITRVKVSHPDQKRQRPGATRQTGGLSVKI